MAHERFLSKHCIICGRSTGSFSPADEVPEDVFNSVNQWLLFFQKFFVRNDVYENAKICRYRLKLMRNN